MDLMKNHLEETASKINKDIGCSFLAKKTRSGINLNLVFYYGMFVYLSKIFSKCKAATAVAFLIKFIILRFINFECKQQ